MAVPDAQCYNIVDASTALQSIVNTNGDIKEAALVDLSFKERILTTKTTFKHGHVSL